MKDEARKIAIARSTQRLRMFARNDVPLAVMRLELLNRIKLEQATPPAPAMAKAA